MKKIFAVILAILMVMSLCACTSESEGNTIAEEKKPVEKFVPFYEGDFTVIKTDWSTYKIYSSGTSCADSYIAVLEYEGTRIVVSVGVEQYACWDSGDIVSGTLKRGSEEYYVSPFPVMLNINGKDFHVSWQGE